MARQLSKAQKTTVERVMREFKRSALESGGGLKVKDPQQAIAIALREAGASNTQSKAKNRAALSKTKSQERRGAKEIARASKPASLAGSTTRRDSMKTKADLMAQARRRDIPGRSRMSKPELERALSR